MLVLLSLSVFGERSPWDCPECGRTGNTGNYCGGCAHPAPWIQTEEDNVASTQDFRTKGNIVTFGHYEQDNDAGNGAEKIEWIVLDYDEKDLLLKKLDKTVKSIIPNYTKNIYYKKSSFKLKIICFLSYNKFYRLLSLLKKYAEFLTVPKTRSHSAAIFISFPMTCFVIPVKKNWITRK